MLFFADDDLFYRAVVDYRTQGLLLSTAQADLKLHINIDNLSFGLKFRSDLVTHDFVPVSEQQEG